MEMILKISPILQLNDAQFYHLCQINQDLRLELTATGELILNPPTGGETGEYNSGLNADFVFWNRKAKFGKVFDSSTGFKLPNGATRSPDVAWVQTEPWQQLTPEQRQGFPPIAPDFVLELMSPSDSLKEAQDKMKEYLDNGVALGWLINRKEGFVEIYRPQQAVERIQLPTVLRGEDVLKGFELELD